MRFKLASAHFDTLVKFNINPIINYKLQNIGKCVLLILIENSPRLPYLQSIEETGPVVPQMELPGKYYAHTIQTSLNILCGFNSCK